MLVDDYTVELLKKLPKYHRKIYEFQQIAKAQTPEIEALLSAVNFVLDSMFAETATEYGISRMEKIVGLTPDPADNLYTRRTKLLVKMSEKIPYTDVTLEERLTSLCGDGNYSINRDYVNYFIEIITKLEDAGSFDTLIEALQKMIPCNLVTSFKNKVSVTTNIFTYTAGVSNVTENIFVTNDILTKVNTETTGYTGMVTVISDTVNV